MEYFWKKSHHGRLSGGVSSAAGVGAEVLEGGVLGVDGSAFGVVVSVTCACASFVVEVSCVLSSPTVTTLIGC
jgi:hypothetical protein